MLIKASSITNLTDARYFAAKDVHYLGFNLEEGTPGYLDPMYMKAIREWVTGPKITGEFDHTPAETVREAAAFFGLDAVQVTHTNELPALAGLEVILSVPATPDVKAMELMLRNPKPFVRYFLLDFTGSPEAASSLTDQPAAWENLLAEYPVFLQLDLPPDRLSEVLHVLQPAGLALRGGDEELVGVKSFEEIDTVFEMLGLD